MLGIPCYAGCCCCCCSSAPPARYSARAGNVGGSAWQPVCRRPCRQQHGEHKGELFSSAVRLPSCIMPPPLQHVPQSQPTFLELPEVLVGATQILHGDLAKHLRQQAGGKHLCEWKGSAGYSLGTAVGTPQADTTQEWAASSVFVGTAGRNPCARCCWHGEWAHSKDRRNGAIWGTLGQAAGNNA